MLLSLDQRGKVVNPSCINMSNRQIQYTKYDLKPKNMSQFLPKSIRDWNHSLRLPYPLLRVQKIDNEILFPDLSVISTVECISVDVSPEKYFDFNSCSRLVESETNIIMVLLLYDK